LTLSRLVLYHRIPRIRPSCRARYDASVAQAIARCLAGRLPVCCRRPCFGASSLTRDSSRPSSQSHSRHSPLHLDVRRRTSARYGHRSPAGRALAHLSRRALCSTRIFVQFLFHARLARSPPRSRPVTLSVGARDRSGFQRAGFVCAVFPDGVVHDVREP
jgi:hypothetical protein